MHVARESKEASAARDIDAALSPRTPPAPCDLARGKTRPVWARDTTIHSVCVCARACVSECQSHFSPVSCVRFAPKGKKTKNNAFYQSIEPLPGNLFRVPIHCINVRHINTEQNQEKTRNYLILREYCLLDVKQFTNHLPVKNEVCPEVEMKDVYFLALQLESVDDLTRVTGLQDGEHCG